MTEPPQPAAHDAQPSGRDPGSGAPDSSAPSGGNSIGGNYVVVARRYRPQTFDELIGQQHVWRALTRAIASERVGHAYLFTGARGVGKTSAARIFAKALNCAQGTSATPCNECEVCQSVSTGNDIDVLEIDGASNRGIDEIRQLRQNVAVRPSRSRFKIYIIDEVHMLTPDGFNALLKTLEEPPEHVKFIFATTEPNKIPVTILSRCQRYDFAGIETADIQLRLKDIAENEGVSIEADAVQILAIRAAGSMRDSQSLLEQLLSTGADRITSADVTGMLGIAPAARLSRLVAPLVERNPAAALTELGAAIDEGAEVSQLLDQLIGYFRDVMTQAVGCDAARMLYALPSQHEEIQQLAEKLGTAVLLAIVQILDQASARLRVSTHARTLAEIALVRICHLEDLDELAGLIRQLNEAPGTTAVPSAGASAVKKNMTPSSAATRATAATGVSPALAHQPATGLASTANPTSHWRGEATGNATAVAEAEVATPATPAPVAAAPLALAPDNVEAVWKRALDSLTGLLMDHAAEADEVVVDESGRLILSFAENFHREFCERGNNRARLENALQEAAGTKVALVMRAHSRVDAAAEAKPRPKSRRQRQADVAAEPFVKKAMELFDGDPARLRYVPPQKAT